MVSRFGCRDRTVLGTKRPSLRLYLMRVPFLFLLLLRRQTGPPRTLASNEQTIRRRRLMWCLFRLYYIRFLRNISLIPHSQYNVVLDSGGPQHLESWLKWLTIGVITREVFLNCKTTTIVPCHRQNKDFWVSWNHCHWFLFLTLEDSVARWRCWSVRFQREYISETRMQRSTRRIMVVL